MDESEVEAQRLHDERMAYRRDARRYRFLQIHGAALAGTEALNQGLVRRCVNLDEEVDALMARSQSEVKNG